MGRWSRASLLLNIARRSTTKPPAAPNFSAFLIKPSHNPKFQEFLGGFRSFSAVPSPALSYTDEYDYGDSKSHDIDQTHVLDSNDSDIVKKIPVKAYFLSTSINLKNMQTENLSNIVPPTSRSSKFITLRYCDFPSKITSLEIEENASSWSYIVVFHYGSVVLFNIEDDEAESYLDIVRRYASGLLPEMRKDDLMKSKS